MPLSLIVLRHLADNHRAVDRILVAHMAAGHVAVTLLKAEQEAVFLALLLQQGDLLTDVLEAGEDVDHLDAVALGDDVS